MDTLPLDALGLICSYVSDRDAINVLSTHQEMRDPIYRKIKSMDCMYVLTQIQGIVTEYDFTNIFYDYAEWDSHLVQPERVVPEERQGRWVQPERVVPQTIQKIKFCHEFKGDVGSVCTFKHLHHITVGMFCTEISGDILHMQNLNTDEIVMSVITNRVFQEKMKEDIDKYFNPGSNTTFPKYLNVVSGMTILKKSFREGKIKNRFYERYQIDINPHIRNTPHESKYLLTNIPTSDDNIYVTFGKFYVDRIISQCKELQRMICAKYGVKDFDGLMLQMHGEEHVKRMHENNRKRREEMRQRRNRNVVIRYVVIQ